MDSVHHGVYVYGVPVECQIPVGLPTRVPVQNVRVYGGIQNHIEDGQSFISYFSQQDDCPSIIRRRNLRFFSDWELEEKLNKYLLTDKQLLIGGFPVDCDGYPGCALVYKSEYYQPQKFANLNPEAQEFIPRKYQKQLAPARDNYHQQGDKSVLLRECKRCLYSYPVYRETGDYVSIEECIYHPGKFLRNVWECCREAGVSIEGCATAKGHVWSGTGSGCNGPLPGFVQTRPLGLSPTGICRYGVYALDCEMAFTKRGLEVIKISVVRLDGLVVYDQYVKPEEDVIDYVTDIHGITEEQVSKAAKTLVDVQNDLLQFIHAESIIVGHGLETDLRVLRIIHNRIIDTSYVFPHEKGFPRRHRLKKLAKSLLQQEIQVAEHDSVEDARAAMDVMLCKLEDDVGLRI